MAQRTLSLLTVLALASGHPGVGAHAIEPARHPAIPRVQDEVPLEDRVAAQVAEVWALAYPAVGSDPGPVLEQLGALRELTRSLTEDSGSYLATVEGAVAEQLKASGHRGPAIDLLESSLERRTAETQGPDSDWYLYLATSRRLELLGALQCLVADRAGCMRALARAEALLAAARRGEYSHRSPEPDERAAELQARAILVLQNRVDAELSFGLIDRAARSMLALEQAFEPRVAAARARGGEWDRDVVEGLYYARRLRLRLLLALDRPESVAPALQAWREQGELERFSPQQRGTLELLEATARFELERTGDVEYSAVSPFERLLEEQAFGTLEPVDQLRVSVLEAARCVELGRDEWAEGRIAGFVEASQGLQADVAEVGMRVLALELRRLHLQLDAGAPPEPARLERLRREFEQLSAPLGGDATIELGSTFLYFGAGTELLSELMEVECAADPGGAGIRRALEHALAIQELGGLAARLGLQSSDGGRLDDLVGLLEHGGDRALIVVPGRNQSRAFLVGRDVLETYELPRAGRIERARSRLEEQLSAFVALGSEAGAAAVGGAAGELRDLLLPAALRADLADAATLAIVGPGALGYVPFELLELAPGEPLGTALAVHYWPSALVARHLHDRLRAAPAELDLALLARTALPGDPRGFELSPSELAVLERPFEPAQRRVYRRDRVTQMQIASVNARTLLIVAHGERPTAERESSGLAIPGAPGEPVLHAGSSLWGLEGLSVPPLVWLGACSAWQGPFRRGDDGTTHLPSRFLEHGARSVVLPFFELRFDDLAVLASRTSAELLAQPGRSVAEALRLARVAAVAGAHDPLGRIAPFLVHELGGPSPLMDYASDSRALERLNHGGAVSRLSMWAWALLSAVVLGAALFVRRRARVEPRAAAPNS